MKTFGYYLFDNYDSKDVKTKEDDPRAVLNEKVDPVLTEVVQTPPGECRYDSLCAKHTQVLVDQLIHIGLFRLEGETVFLDAPVFVQEDHAALKAAFSNDLSRMVERINLRKDDFYQWANQLNNGFSPEVNLYHVLCGAILDGSFFDELVKHDLVATSRIHKSGLDYLIIVYEKSPDLNDFSNKLLCSYNRFSDGKRTLQSFGDAEGERVDAFRFMCQKRLGKVPQRLAHIEKLWDALGTNDVKEVLLSEMQQFVETGSCNETCLKLLTEFGYFRNGKMIVPVYLQEHNIIIQALTALTIECIFDLVQKALTSPELFSNLWCGKHGVSSKEIANELYHIVFGQLNELLVQSGFVCEPEFHSGEGRYLKSIEIM